MATGETGAHCGCVLAGRRQRRHRTYTGPACPNSCKQLVIENAPEPHADCRRARDALAPDGSRSRTAAPRILPSVFKQLSLIRHRFAPISHGCLPALLVSHPSIPAKNVKELIAFLRRACKIDSQGARRSPAPHLARCVHELRDGMLSCHTRAAMRYWDTSLPARPVTMANPLAALRSARGRLRAYGGTTASRAVGALHSDQRNRDCRAMRQFVVWHARPRSHTARDRFAFAPRLRKVLQGPRSGAASSRRRQRSGAKRRGRRAVPAREAGRGQRVQRARYLNNIRTSDVYPRQPRCRDRQCRLARGDLMSPRISLAFEL